MMEPADLRERNDVAHSGRLNCARHGTVPIEREMGPRLVVVGEVASQDTSQVFLVEDDDVIEALAQKVLWAKIWFAEGDGLFDLKGGPVCRWGICDIEVEHSSPVVRENDESKQGAKRCGGHREEVGRHEITDVIIEESSPGWRRRFANVDPVLGNGGLRNVDADLEKLAVDPGRPPQRVGFGHPADEVSDFPCHRGTSRIPSLS